MSTLEKRTSEPCQIDSIETTDRIENYAAEGIRADGTLEIDPTAAGPLAWQHDFNAYVLAKQAQGGDDRTAVLELVSKVDALTEHVESYQRQAAMDALEAELDECEKVPLEERQWRAFERRVLGK